jgi:hypothetical protein
MENAETPKKKRVYKLKFDQLWVDAINQIPVCYHSEIYYWLDYYQNHNHSDLIGTIKDDLVRSLFMLIYPTIRRRRLARERQRRYCARKKAARLAAEASTQTSAASKPSSPAMQTERAAQDGHASSVKPDCRREGYRSTRPCAQEPHPQVTRGNDDPQLEERIRRLLEFCDRICPPNSCYYVEADASINSG